VKDMPVACQSRDRARRSELAKPKDLTEGESVLVYLTVRARALRAAARGELVLLCRTKEPKTDIGTNGSYVPPLPRSGAVFFSRSAHCGFRFAPVFVSVQPLLRWGMERRFFPRISAPRRRGTEARCWEAGTSTRHSRA